MKRCIVVRVVMVMKFGNSYSGGQFYSILNYLNKKVSSRSCYRASASIRVSNGNPDLDRVPHPYMQAHIEAL
jgi:hypothetical protein